MALPRTRIPVSERVIPLLGRNGGGRGEDDNSPTCALHCKHYFIRYGSLHVVQRNKEKKTPISRARKEEDDSSQAESTGQLRNLVIGASSTIGGETEGLLRCTCRDNPMQATYMYVCVVLVYQLW